MIGCILNDHVYCLNCETEQVVVKESEVCLNCNADGCLRWRNEEVPEVDMDPGIISE